MEEYRINEYLVGRTAAELSVIADGLEGVVDEDPKKIGWAVHATRDRLRELSEILRKEADNYLSGGPPETEQQAVGS